MLSIFKTRPIPVSKEEFAGETIRNIVRNIEEIFVLSLLYFVDGAIHWHPGDNTILGDNMGDNKGFASTF
jgi:hypothetical protein